ncbi:hypothetical protein K439DRAFT_1630517 [Ramaria rubella]|nr:hypothetical protein K439DRAFT_1630517 [Ramaria rubella]
MSDYLALSESTALTQERSTFQCALDEYIQGLPEKRQKGRFVIACTSGGDAITTQSLNESIKRAEEKKSSKGIIKKILTPVVTVLKDYDAVVNALISADPMPTAIIWGALKVVIDGISRYTDLFETIRQELGSLTFQLKRINEYEHLYGDSKTMQDLLCKSYINIIRFWSRVDKECNRCCRSAIRRAATSFSTNKLNEIVGDLKRDADEIWKTASVIEATKARRERQCTNSERNQASLERFEARQERRAAQESRVERLNERRMEHHRYVRSWIGSHQWNEANSTRHGANKKKRQDGTYEWLATHPTYSAWRNGHSNPSILWLHGPPGFGKSTICSHAIQLVQDSDPQAVVVYHFYQEQVYSECETLRILAGQLFEHYGRRSNEVSEELYFKTQRMECSLEIVKELITTLVTMLHKTYFFIDGLDEEATSPTSPRWTEASSVLDFLVQLCSVSPDTVRVWYSSQFRPSINEKLQGYVTFDIKKQVKADVMLYLSVAMSSAIPELDELEEEKDSVLENLQSRAEGNFLCASLMVKAIQEEANSLSEIKQFIERGLPKKLDDYYRRIFGRIEKPQRLLARNVFALIAFSRRPLRMKEIREAAGLLHSKTPHSPKAADMPWIKRLRQLCAPLIDVQEDLSDDDVDDCNYGLFHSTVREFLDRNPTILGKTLPITPRIISDACVRYLSQARYAQLLTKSDVGWTDAHGEPVDRHQFLSYAAKYWDKHLNDVSESEELRKQVLSFITSSNFQTCIQIQSLWVDGKFEVFRVRGDDTHTYLLRVFPIWFTPHAQNLWKDYRHFVHEWGYLLRCGSCRTPGCLVKPFTGEVDRCWWAALGHRSFLSKFQGKYVSFLFQEGDNFRHGGRHGFMGVNEAGDVLKVLRLHSQSQDTLEFICEHWSLLAGKHAPTLERKQPISAHEKSTNWSLYEKDSMLRTGKAVPAMFSPDCRLLRIGAQLFALNDRGEYAPMAGLSTQDDAYPSYVEEFASNRSYVVLATRRNINVEDIYESGVRDRGIKQFGENLIKMEERLMAACDWSDDEIGDGDSESDISYSSSMDSEDGAYETWSECSTEHSEDVCFEDDVVTPWAGPAEVEKDGLSDSSQSSIMELEEDPSEDGQSNASDLDRSELPASAIIGYGQRHSDDEDDNCYGEDIYDEVVATRPRRSCDPQASLVVFDISCPMPRRIFHFSYAISSMLYVSPPVVHPSESLAVWPIGGGDVLFADFVANTYFMRKIRPSTTHTRHIFMKCHFSHCGKYLHIASLEGQHKPAPNSRRNAKLPQLKIALLLSTYRLCARKVAKSPPTLIHRARVRLDPRTSLTVSHLPYTMTWTPDELYFTCSADTLRVYRIQLFNDPEDLKTWGEGGVQTPNKTVFLPSTAAQREVFYFPPTEGNTAALIIVGSEARGKGVDVNDKAFGGLQANLSPYIPQNVVGLNGHLSPPVGCYLEDEDIGGWGESEDRSLIPEDMGIGRLDRRREKFDPDDDCDLELYIL